MSNKELKNKIEAYELFIKYIYENSYIEFTANDVIDEAEKSLTEEQKIIINKLIGVEEEQDNE